MRTAPGISGEEAPPPASDDRNHDRILRLQTALRDIVHAAFGRLKVGLRVIEAHSGKVIFGRAPMTLMDPASNQKVLATTTALLRLGSDWTFRTEVYGAQPDDDGVVEGNLYLRGSGNPTLGARELDELANKLAARGVKRVTGGIIADPRRIGDDGPVTFDDQRPQLTINRGLVVVRVHPSEPGEAPAVVLDPPPPPVQSGRCVGLRGRQPGAHARRAPAQTGDRRERGARHAAHRGCRQNRQRQPWRALPAPTA